MRFTGANQEQRMNVWREYEAVLALPRSMGCGVVCYGSRGDFNES